MPGRPRAFERWPGLFRLAVAVCLLLIAAHLADALSSVLVARNQERILAKGFVTILHETNPALDPQEQRLGAYLAQKFRGLSGIIAVLLALPLLGGKFLPVLAPVARGCVMGCFISAIMGSVAAACNFALYAFGTNPGHMLIELLKTWWPEMLAQREMQYRIHVILDLVLSLPAAVWFERRFQLLR